MMESKCLRGEIGFIEKDSLTKVTDRKVEMWVQVPGRLNRCGRESR